MMETAERAIQVLVASASPSRWDELRSGLAERGVTLALAPATAAGADGALAAAMPACIVLDPGAVDAGAIELARVVRAATAVPIFVVGEPDAEVEARSLAAGVTDWLSVTDLAAARIAQRLRHAVRCFEAEAVSAAAVTIARETVAARDDLLAFVAHDLRAPFHSIRIACGELASDLPFDVAARFIRAIETAARRGEDLIAELLDLAKIDSHQLKLELRAVDLRPLIRRACDDHELIASSSRTRLSASQPDGPTRVMADPRWIARVLANLVGNALVHARGTEVAIEVSAGPTAVTIAVVDGGRGIALEELPHVFDRFWQGRLHRGGAGLGLAIAKGIVEAHGGTISAANGADRGARFAFTLPTAV